MRRNKGKKLLALVVATIMMVAMIGATVSAAAKYTPVEGTSTKFTKYLVVPNGLKIPALTFNFTIAPGTAVAGNADNLPVYAGNDAKRVVGAPSIEENQAAFTEDQATTAGAVDDGIANSEEYKYASKEVTVSFSGVKFNEPGVYRYIITENTTTPTGVDFDKQPVRTLDVNVVDDKGELKVAYYVMYYGSVTAAQNKTTVKKDTDKKNAEKTGITDGDKCDSYVNHYPSHSLYIGKKISGNQASKDKYFRITVSLAKAGSESLIHVGGNYTTDELTDDTNGATDILETGDKYTNPPTFTTEADGSKTVVFYLQGDQYVNLMGLPNGAHYEVTEEDYSADGYVKKATLSTDNTTHFSIGSGTEEKTFNADTTGDIGTSDILTGFTNTKNGVIPTGVIVSATALIIAAIVAFAGVVFFGMRSKRKFEEE